MDFYKYTHTKNTLTMDDISTWKIIIIILLEYKIIINE